jgi:hypothetical protein
MKRLITTFASAILLFTSTACVTQPTCNVEEMIAMKDKKCGVLGSRLVI